MNIIKKIKKFFWKGPRKYFTIIFLNIFLGLFFFFWETIFFQKNEILSATFFDVGQGDSALIQYKDFSLLIDGGSSRAVQGKIQKALPFFDREIDYLVITHPEKDHYYGLLDIAKTIHVRSVIVSADHGTNESYNSLIAELRKKQIPIFLAHAIDKIQIAPDFEADILSPVLENDPAEKKKTNNHSVVLRLSYKNIDFLFTGDIEAEKERWLVSEYGSNLESEIFKVPHHGSDTSSSEIFLQTVQPKISIISVGKNNSYGHPRGRTLFYLKHFGSEIERTDREGNIIIETDGMHYWRK